MPEFQSRLYHETLAAMRAKRLRDPDFWEWNATIQRHPEFRQAAINFAKKLRERG